MAAIPELTTEKPRGISHSLGRLLQAVHQVVLKEDNIFITEHSRREWNCVLNSTVNCDFVYNISYDYARLTVVPTTRTANAAVKYLL